MIIDFHTHVFPDFLSSPSVPFQHFLRGAQKGLKNSLKKSLGLNLAETFHNSKALIRHLPGFAQPIAHHLEALAESASLLVGSTEGDLLNAMKQSQVDYALVMAQPPLIENEFVMALAAKHSALLPVANVSHTLAFSPKRLKQQILSWTENRVRALKVDGELGSNGKQVQASLPLNSLIRQAIEQDLLLIFQTGRLNPVVFRHQPRSFTLEELEPLIQKYPSATFVLAHMNQDQPLQALELCERFPNVLVDTSYQPAELMGAAVQRIGTERVLFASGWPGLGHSIQVGLSRIQQCVEYGWMTEADAALVRGGNAQKLLRIDPHAV